MNCSRSSLPFCVHRSGVDATFRDGAHTSFGSTGRNVDGAILGSIVTSQVIDPSPTVAICSMAGAKAVASGNHCPTTPFGNETSTFTLFATGDQKYRTGV